MSDLALTEVRTCPECRLAAHRVPELDTAEAVAFRCLDWPHPPFWVPVAEVQPPAPVIEPTRKVGKKLSEPSAPKDAGENAR